MDENIECADAYSNKYVDCPYCGTPNELHDENYNQQNHQCENCEKWFIIVDPK